MVSDPLTKFMFCSPAEGGAALVLVSDKKMRELGLTGPRILGAAVRTRVNGSFEVFAPSLDVERGPSPTQIASKAAYAMAGIEPNDIDVAQIQDTESGAEIMHMSENGLCADGEQEKLISEGSHAYRRQASDQHRWWLPCLRRADRRIWPAPSL